MCNGPGKASIEVDGAQTEVDASLLASYSSTHAEANWTTVRHAKPPLAELGRQAFDRLYEQLSPATQQCGGFNAFDVRTYDGSQYTDLHTDTRVALGADGRPKKLCNQARAPSVPDRPAPSNSSGVPHHRWKAQTS